MSERSIIKVEDGKIKYTGKVKLPDGTIRVQPEGGIKFIKNKKDGGLMEAIEKVKKENPVKMEKGGGSAEEKLKQLLDELKSIPQDKYTPKRDQDRIDSIMGQISKISGMRKGGEAIPAKFKGFSKLPEAVQEKMDPGLAKKFERGGPVKMGSGGGVCRGMGAARAGGKFKLR